VSESGNSTFLHETLQPTAHPRAPIENRCGGSCNRTNTIARTPANLRTLAPQRSMSQLLLQSSRCVPAWSERVSERERERVRESLCFHESNN